MATPEREPAGSRQCRMRPSLRGGFKWASLAFVRSAALVWLVLAAACTSYGKTVEDEQQEAYARAYVALIAKHPDALADLSRNVGARPSSCDLAYGGAAVPAAVCACTWRFLTKEGAKEITATAMFRDPRDSEVDTVTMLMMDAGRAVEMAADDAERSFRAGSCGIVPRNGGVAVQASDGRLWAIDGAGVDSALKNGAHLTTARRLKGAEVDRAYASMTGLQRIDTCLTQPARVTGLKMGGSQIAW